MNTVYADTTVSAVNVTGVNLSPVAGEVYDDEYYQNKLYTGTRTVGEGAFVVTNYCYSQNGEQPMNMPHTFQKGETLYFKLQLSVNSGYQLACFLQALFAERSFLPDANSFLAGLL